MWLRDALPRDLPKARVLIYGYDSTVAGSESFQNLGDIASSFRASLKEVTSNMRLMRPFIFIAHSLGGLVLKQALLQMATSEDEDDARHLKETSDILFFGVPNQGLELSSLYPMAHGQLNLAFLSTLDRNSIHLQKLVTEFNIFDLSDTRIISFYETRKSPTARQDSPGRWSMSGEHAVLVDRWSATSGRPWNKTLPIDRNHSDMVKFRRMDNVYNTVRGYLKKSAKHAPAVIYNEPRKLLANPSTSTPVEPQEYPSVNVQNPRPTRSVSNLPKTNDVTTLPFGKDELSISAKSLDISHEAVSNGTRPISDLPELSDEITTPFRTKELSTSTDSLDISRKAVTGRAVARTDRVEQQRALQALSAAGFKMKDSQFSLNEALPWAVQHGNEAAVRWLLQEAKENPADVGLYFPLALDRQPLLNIAASKKFQAITRLLLDWGADVNAKDRSGMTALHRAAYGEHEAIVRLLLERGADINAISRSGMTALHVAAEYGHEAIVRLLLEEGADINAKSRSRMTALHVAAEYGHEAILRLLLEGGAHSNIKAEHGMIALHCAVYKGYEAIARLLLANGSDIHAIHLNGDTALHIAMIDGNMRIVQLLLKKGANPNARNYLHETPLNVARKEGKMTVVKLLEPLTR
jgi:ankyrin repeat protein